MFAKIFTIVESHILGMGLVFALLIILLDQKAIGRINNKPIIKIGAYISITIYYLLIILDVIRKIRIG